MKDLHIDILKMILMLKITKTKNEITKRNWVWGGVLEKWLSK